jgi:hypothetical protein
MVDVGRRDMENLVVSGAAPGSFAILPQGRGGGKPAREREEG